MPKFRYTAVSATGAKEAGVREVPDAHSLVVTLRAEGLYTLKYREVSGDSQGGGLFSPKIKIRTLAMFCTQMAAVLAAGVPLATALEIMKGQINDKEMKKILDDVNDKLQMGRSLSESFAAFRGRFPNMFHNMLEAGEASGDLEGCLNRAGEAFTKQDKLNGKVKGALAYPVALLVMTLALSVFLVAYILPQFATVFESSGTDLPATTKFLMSLSDGLIENWRIILAGVLLFIIVLRVVLSTEAGKMFTGKMKLRMPLIGKLMTVVYAGRYTRTLSAMSSAGVSLPTALDVTARSMGNYYIQSELFKMIEEVKMGETMSVLLERMDIFPPMIVHMTRMGEASGTLDELFEKAAEFYEEQSDGATAQLTALLNPIIIGFMGIVVATVILSVIQPMFNMYDAM